MGDHAAKRFVTRGDIMHKLRRNKVLTPRHGLMLAAIDGHETHASYKRRHEGCLERKVTAGGREMTQYCHRFTVFQLIGRDFYLPIDAEPVLPGDDEVASAMRLLARVLVNHPRCFDVLTADAIYLRPSVIDNFAELIAADLLEDRWWPTHPP
ncbi:MAG: hypothetical protein NTW21_08400 [Verrucomicrobia bacterium]|nr:hypothetical protein [Verrucomicrobiota bacterium]